MEDDEYYEITSQLDAREILRYLNNLGIHNISGEVLKYFITDLKKLIKYDLQQKQGIHGRKTEDIIIGPERLHSASTFSSRCRSRCHNDVKITCSRECQKGVKPMGVRKVQSAPNTGQQKTEEKLPKRACSCVRIDRKIDTPKEVHKTLTNVNSNIIKVPKQPIKKKCDPVSLYHYYTSLWAKYKPNVPGENNWSELRWNIRQKMVDSQTSKGSDVRDKENIRIKKNNL